MPVLVTNVFQIWRTEALYWSAENPEHFAADTFPTFLHINDEEYFEIYGIPINEYSGLLRVNDDRFILYTINYIFAILYR